MKKIESPASAVSPIFVGIKLQFGRSGRPSALIMVRCHWRLMVGHRTTPTRTYFLITGSAIEPDDPPPDSVPGPQGPGTTPSGGASTMRWTPPASPAPCGTPTGTAGAPARSLLPSSSHHSRVGVIGVQIFETICASLPLHPLPSPSQ